MTKLEQYFREELISMVKRDEIYFIGQVRHIIDLKKRGLDTSAKYELEALDNVTYYLYRTNQLARWERDYLLDLKKKLRNKYEIY